MEDDLHPKTNHLIVQELKIQNSKLNVSMKSRTFYWKNSKKRKISKYIGKYVNFLKLFHRNLVFLLVASGSKLIASFISAIGAPVELIASFITIFFTLSIGFVKLFLSTLKSNKSIISKAIQKCYISEKILNFRRHRTNFDRKILIDYGYRNDIDKFIKNISNNRIYK